MATKLQAATLTVLAIVALMATWHFVGMPGRSTTGVTFGDSISGEGGSLRQELTAPKLEQSDAEGREVSVSIDERQNRFVLEEDPASDPRPTALDVELARETYNTAKQAILEEVLSEVTPVPFTRTNLAQLKSDGVDYVVMLRQAQGEEREGGAYSLDPAKYKRIYDLRDAYLDMYARSGEQERQKLAAEKRLRELTENMPWQTGR